MMFYQSRQNRKQSFFEKKDQKAFALTPASVPALVPQACRLAEPGRMLGQARRQKLFGPFSRKRTTCLLASIQAAPCLCILVYATAAQAHAFLEGAVPRVGSTIPTPPNEVALIFTQGVEPAFSKLEVTDAGGTHVENGAAHTAGSDKTKLAVSVGKLAPGTYLVSWHVTSVDTHKTQGQFRFTVAP